MVARVPENVVAERRECVGFKTGSCLEENLADEILAAKYLVHEAADEVNVFVGDLDKAGAGSVQQILGDEKAVAEIAQVGVDAEFPGIAEGLDLLGLAGKGVVLAVGDGAVVEANL